jgi:hypothetical protein
MKKNVVFCLSASIVALGVCGACVSFPDYEKMDIQTPQNNSHSILNLRNESNLRASLLRQSERIMKSGFLDVSTEEYGYFSIGMEQSSLYSQPSTPILILSGATLFFGYPVWLLLGIPSDRGEGNFTATLRIYDSNGTLIKTYTETTRVVKYAGLYYSGDMTEKAATQYTKLFESIFESAQMQSAEINRALRAAGPLTPEKETAHQAQRAKIDAANAAAQAAAANVPSPTIHNYNYSEPQTNDSSTKSASSQPKKRLFSGLVWYLDNGARKSIPLIEQAFTADEAEKAAERKFKTGPIGLQKGIIFLEAVAN